MHKDAGAACLPADYARMTRAIWQKTTVYVRLIAHIRLFAFNKT